MYTRWEKWLNACVPHKNKKMNSGNVQNYLTGIFHPVYTWVSGLGFQARLDTSLNGNVYIGTTSTSYSLLLNGNPIIGPASWAQFPAVTDVNLSGHFIFSTSGGSNYPVTVSGDLMTTGGVDVASNLAVNGNIAANGNLAVNGNIGVGGTINGVQIGSENSTVQTSNYSGATAPTITFTYLANNVSVGTGSFVYQEDIAAGLSFFWTKAISNASYSITSSYGGATVGSFDTTTGLFSVSASTGAAYTARITSL